MSTSSKDADTFSQQEADLDAAAHSVKRWGDLRVYSILCMVILLGLVPSWQKALDSGGLWWFATGTLFIAGLFIGERLKKTLDELVRLSREQREKDLSIRRSQRGADAPRG